MHQFIYVQQLDYMFVCVYMCVLMCECVCACACTICVFERACKRNANHANEVRISQ